MSRVNQDWRADPRRDRLLQCDIPNVIAAHETDLHQALAVSDLGIDDSLRPVRRRRQRLLAEARLPSGDRRQHILLVRRAPGRHEDRVDLRRGDERLARLEDFSLWRDLRLDLLGGDAIDVAERDDFTASQDLVDTAGVIPAYRPRADDANSNSHAW